MTGFSLARPMLPPLAANHLFEDRPSLLQEVLQ